MDFGEGEVNEESIINISITIYNEIVPQQQRSQEVDQTTRVIKWVTDRYFAKHNLIERSVRLITSSSHPDRRYIITKLLQQENPRITVEWERHLKQAKSLYKNWKQLNQKTPGTNLGNFFTVKPNTSNVTNMRSDIPNFQYMTREPMREINIFYHKHMEYMLNCLRILNPSSYNDVIINNQWWTDRNNNRLSYDQFKNGIKELIIGIPLLPIQILDELQKDIQKALAGRIYCFLHFDWIKRKSNEHLDFKDRHCQIITCLIVLSARIRQAFRTYGRSSKVY